ncbi:Gfo/Idh/MocA family protein [candidate division KSB1 bacterium]
MSNTRRDFLKKLALGSAGITVSSLSRGFSSRSYANILGSNDRVRVGIVGFSDRAKYSLIPAFQAFSNNLNFDIVAVSDIWKRRRDEGLDYFKKEYDKSVETARNNEELYENFNLDAVIISTADFQHALHTIDAVEAGCDVYVEKPFAETMEDNRKALKAVESSDRIVQIGTQRRSGANYMAAKEYIDSGKFGNITIVEMTWNVNQPGRWRRPNLVKDLNERDTDWKRYLINRPYEDWHPRKYIEYRLFWPYSSGIPGQWMTHQIDTVHWFSGLKHPRSVVANGGIYMWNDGRKNWDTMTAVFDYGPDSKPEQGFQVVYSSRMHNSAGGVKELYFSNGGTLNLLTNKVTPGGGLTEGFASAMNMKEFLLGEYTLPTTQVETAANTGSDPMTTAHMLNWMECVSSRKKPNADIHAGYEHAIANIMTTAAIRTGQRATFDEKRQEVISGDDIFKY